MRAHLIASPACNVVYALITSHYINYVLQVKVSIPSFTEATRVTLYQLGFGRLGDLGHIPPDTFWVTGIPDHWSIKPAISELPLVDDLHDQRVDVGVGLRYFHRCSAPVACRSTELIVVSEFMFTTVTVNTVWVRSLTHSPTNTVDVTISTNTRAMR